MMRSFLQSCRGFRRFVKDSNAVTALEFALLAPIFIALLIFTIEFSLDLIWQSTLDAALGMAARRIQTGNAKTAQNGSNFVSTFVCPNLLGLATCDSVYVRVQRIMPTGQQDYFDFTTVQVPSLGSTLDLSSYASSAYCNAGPSQMLLVSAIFVAPTFVAGFLPGNDTLIYNGISVHAVFSSLAVETEGYWTPATGGGAAPSC